MSETTPSPKRRRRKYVPAVGPRLEKLLMVVFGLFALLAINAVYLVGVSLLEWWTGNTYQTWFYMNMFLVHLVLGLLFVLPVVIFGIIHIRNSYDRPNRRAVRAGPPARATARRKENHRVAVTSAAASLSTCAIALV